MSHPRFYTVRLREPPSRRDYYVGADLKVYPTAERCKRLTWADARKAAQQLRDGAAKLGREIKATVVLLPET
jgi:phage-related baseplate assembly protein